MLENIRGNDFINVSTDKFSISTRQRVINYYILVKAGSFCMEQAPVRISLVSAKWQADFLEERFEALKIKLSYDERLPMINSVATNTCAIMRSLWAKLDLKKRFKYTFFVPCDSHGL